MTYAISFDDLTCPKCMKGKLLLKNNNLQGNKQINTHYMCTRCKEIFNINWILKDEIYIPSPEYNMSRLDEFTNEFGICKNKDIKVKGKEGTTNENCNDNDRAINPEKNDAEKN